ncbi:CaiB/BaiF CoA transferase family protein [Variovorax paradoxus]|uniref:CaiB/BaiF CoA transferase family protein n=1 Tax=Variovorax paradoxus TaxID=34073 RepID=UPI0007814C34|nr:CoA transferase [Variovorax paradoxus]
MDSNTPDLKHGPLTGIRVIDLTTVISGPLSTMMLADQGADVIKIETPDGGDYSRALATRRNGFSAAFVNNNRNKRSVTLDLKSAAGIAVLRELIKKADVLVQNFRPGVAQRLGIGPKEMRALNPRLIYASIAGFGFEGPLVHKPVYDPLIQAVSSLTTVQGGSDDDRPRLVRTVLPDKLTGYQTAQAIAAALYARERQGEGQEITVSMLDTVVGFLWSSDMNGHTFVGDELEREESQSFIDLIYKLQDGYVSVSIMQDKHWRDFAGAVDRLDLLLDRRFSTAELREINRDARLQAIQDAISDFTVEELIDRLERADVPHAQVLTRTQMRKHPQVEANGTIIEYDHPLAGKLRQARHAAVFSRTPTSVRRGAPSLGEHTRVVLHDFGVDIALIDSVSPIDESESIA